MKNPLDLIKTKLNKYPISSLTPEELKIYFDHRLEKIVRDKKVLTISELRYLLCETGPGDRRFDPRYISILFKDDILTTSPYGSIPEISQLGDRKKKVHEYLTENRDSEETRSLLLKVLGTYIKGLKVIFQEPLVIEGTFGKIPISCIIRNGQWMLPDTELFSFLQQAQSRKRLPIIVAKKLSGILFPVFKGVSALGLNLYKTYLPKHAQKLVDAAMIPADGPLRELKYCDQFQYLTKEYIEEITDEYWIGDPIKNFFEEILPIHAENYYQNSLDLKLQIVNNFIDTVSQFRKSKPIKGLLNSYEAQENLIRELTKITKD